MNDPDIQEAKTLISDFQKVSLPLDQHGCKIMILF